MIRTLKRAVFRAVISVVQRALDATETINPTLAQPPPTEAQSAADQQLDDDDISPHLQEAVERLQELRADKHPAGCHHQECIKLRARLRGYLNKL